MWWHYQPLGITLPRDNNIAAYKMDYLRALELNYSPFRLLLLDVVNVLREQGASLLLLSDQA